MASPWTDTFEQNFPKPEPKRMTVIGTCYFVSVQAAISYYRPYGYPNLVAAIDEKLAAGEIYIGKPTISDDEALVLLDGGKRYGIQTRI